MSMTCLLLQAKAHLSLKTERPETGPLCVAKPKPDSDSNMAPPGHEDANPIGVSVCIQMHPKGPGPMDNS